MDRRIYNSLSFTLSENQDFCYDRHVLQIKTVTHVHVHSRRAAWYNTMVVWTLALDFLRP